MIHSTCTKVGALCLILAAPLFLAANVIAGLAWEEPAYSWAVHNISDLGNVHCGTWDTTRPRAVCSPWHVFFNASFVLTAVLLAAGTVLTGRAGGRGAVVRTTQVLLLLAAGGYGLAAFPADVNENNHFLGALLIMGVGNVGMLIACLAPRATPLGRIRPLTVVLAVTAAAGTTLFFSQQGLGIGVGGMERVAVFPLLIWATCLGTRIVTAPGDDPSTVPA
ncbi:DUF998 domain-containing protein [Aeromicrobium sp. CTD01-1L150]|uniref:DUF998 domain-containing protein n=1 Tax=Aeromicrobium sp. CTD01-1L150 TaxID=3341830 RepID=UPI0035C18BCA